MPDGAIQYLIQIGIDPQAAQQAVQGVDKFRAGIDSATKSAQKLSEQGAKMREVGATMAAAGASILGPLAAAADQYATRYKGLTAEANAYNAALQKQADATTSLGRAAATALTPMLNQAADALQRVAAFADAHPDLMSTGVQIGTFLVAGGIAVATAGQMITSYGKLSALFGGNLAGKMGEVGIALGAMALAAEGTVAVLNAYGKATGDSNLATFNLGKAFDTAKQGVESFIIMLIDGIGKAINTIQLAVEDLKHAADPKWLAPDPNAPKSAAGRTPGGKGNETLQGEGILPTVPLKTATPKVLTNVSGLLPGDSVPPPGSTPPAKVNGSPSFMDIVNAGIINAILPGAGQPLVSAGKILTQTLPELQGSISNLGGGGAPSPRDEFMKQQADALAKAKLDAHLMFSSAAGDGTGDGTKPPPTPTGVPEATKAYIAYQRQLADSETQYNQSKLDMQTSFQNDSIKSELDYQQSITKAKSDANRSAQEADTRALIDFNHNEAQIKKTADFNRLQSQKQFNASQLELAAQGDVAGYIAAQKARTFQLQQDDRQQSYDATQRKQQYEWDQQQRHAQDAQTLKDSLAALALQHSQEKTAKQVAYDDQLKQLATKHDQEKKAYETAYATQLADLTANTGNLNTIQAAYYAQQTAAATDFVTRNQAELQKLYSMSLTPGGVSYTSTPTVGALHPGAGIISGLMPGYSAPMTALGISGSSSSSSSSITVAPGAVNITIGANNAVTKSEVNAAITNAFGGLSKAIASAK